jgi:hypothetical protein
MTDETTTGNNINSDAERADDLPLPERDEKGKWLPGISPNPKGRPKKKTFADYFTEEEIADLINTVKQASKDKTDVMKLTVEQIFGRAKQPLVGGDEGDNPISITGINYITPDGDNSKTGPKATPSISSPERSED